MDESGLTRSMARPSLRAQLREDVACVFERDPAARGYLEVLLTYPGVHAILWHRVAYRLWWRGWRFAARLLAYLARIWTNIEIHPAARIGRRFFIDHGAGVVVGETAVIGDDVTLYHGVTLGGTTWSQGKRHPTIGDGVMVGAGAKVLGPITIGAGARVGANSVVVKDVPPGCTVVGIPGKVVSAREAGAVNPYGIDLNHHLIPDPVGKAIASLVERIAVLEARVAAAGRQRGGVRAEKEPAVYEPRVVFGPPRLKVGAPASWREGPGSAEFLHADRRQCAECASGEGGGMTEMVTGRSVAHRSVPFAR